MPENFSDRGCLHNRCDNFEFSLTLRAALHVDGKNSGEEFCPTHAASTFWNICRCIDTLCSGFFARRLRNDLRADLGVRGKATKESRQVDPGRRDEGRKFLYAGVIHFTLFW